MKTVTMDSYDEKTEEFKEVATISWDGIKLTGEGDEQTVAYVLSEPIIARGGGRKITADEPEEFLKGLQWHYRSVILSAGPVQES